MSPRPNLGAEDQALLDPDAKVLAEFDGDDYLSRYPDVASAGIPPWKHYSAVGWREGRDPTDWFSSSSYLAANADVAAAGLEPFSHYVLSGREEGRPLTTDAADGASRRFAESEVLVPVIAEFDADYYAAANPDVARGKVGPFQHYLEAGWLEYRDPTRWFSTRRYLEANEDVAATGVNPFVHYILNGRREGRSLEHDLGFRYDLIRDTDKFEPYIQALARFVPDPASSPPDVLIDRLSQDAGSDVHITVSHDDYTTSLGGVQLCLKIESQAMRTAGATHIHLFPGAVSPVVDIQRETPRLGVVVDGERIGHFDADTVGDALASTCRGRKTTLAIHSLIGHRVSDVIAVASRLNIAQAYYWLHDYSSLCANYALMRNDAVFCGPPPPQSLACEICTYGARRQIHLAHHVGFFEALDPVVIAPSEAALAVWRRSFPLGDRPGVVHNHATFSPDNRRMRKSGSTLAEGPRPLRVGFLGMPTVHKGWPVFARLAKRFAGDPRYAFHHLARETDPSIPTVWTRVAPTKAKPAPMIDAVHSLEIDVALIWSLWPETFCFAAYEAVAGGAAIVTNPDSGNVRDLVQRLNRGLLVEDDVVLAEMFASGAIAELVRAHQRPDRQSLAYSRMTADLILDCAT